jgi:NAD-dependent DNA ligase
MSEQDGWNWVYANAAPKRPPKSPGVCFTGFSADRRAELESIASDAHLRPVGSVSKSLLILVVGENAGPSKVQAARELGVPIVDESGFLEFLETGELPVANP